MDTRGTPRRPSTAGRRMLGAIAAVVTSLALAACGGDEPEAETGSAPAVEQGDQSTLITISDFTYQVPETVEPGATITVRNEDGVGHTVTSDDGAFDLAVGPGEEATLTVPEEAGEYPFHCTPHPQMTSTLVVG